VKQEIQNLRDPLERALASAPIRWVPHENIHLTVKFLGEISNDQVVTIQDRLEIAISNIPGFEIGIGSLGCFPNLRQPRVVWLGTHVEGNILGQIVHRIEEAMQALGFEKERRAFKPHLTLGRIKKKISPEQRGILEEHIQKSRDAVFGQIQITEVHLMKSVLRPSGAEYSPLGSAHLKRVV
jgi:2'-5' RNA ligase